MLSNYSFTVTIPKFKNVWYFQDHVNMQNGYKRQFGKLSFNNQETYFRQLVRVADDLIGHRDFALPSAWVVEKFPTDPTRYHMHGTFYEITVDKMKEIQLNWARIIGFRCEKQINDCIFINKLNSPYAWDFYLLKDQELSLSEMVDCDLADCFNCVYGFKGKE